MIDKLARDHYLVHGNVWADEF